MLKLSTIVLTLCLSFSSFAECTKDVQKLGQGDAAPCQGWLVSEPTMQQMAKTKDELDVQKKLILVNEQLRKLDAEEIEFYKKRSENSASELRQEEKKRFWSNLGMFTLGVVLTGVAAKAAIEASR